MKELKFTELKKLIELCRDTGVSEFSFGDIRVVFGGQTKAVPLTPTDFQTKESEVSAQQIEKEAFTESSAELDERDLSLMQVENPAMYEQLLIEGELEDDGSGSDVRDAEQSAIDASLNYEEFRARNRAQTSQH